MSNYKVTIKHFLHTNLKAIVINKVNHYPLYIAITVKRRTTRIRSIAFDEHYSEEQFNQMFDNSDEECTRLLNNEISSIECIARLLVGELKEFNAKFFYSYLSFASKLNTMKVSFDDLKYHQNESSQMKLIELIGRESILGFGIDFLLEYIKGDLYRNVNLFEYFANEYQNNAIKFLETKKIKFGSNEVLNDVNKIFFYLSLEFFEVHVNANPKTKNLSYDYISLFDEYPQILADYLLPKYGH